ncbi:MAG: hypothetical protein ACPGJV_04300 [Bacteriovoracaceae bacterium]
MEVSRRDELIVEGQKKVLDQVVYELSQQDQSLYYVDSSTIAQIIVEYIEEGKLNEQDLELVKGLSRKDILVLLSYNSSCC